MNVTEVLTYVPYGAYHVSVWPQEYNNEISFIDKFGIGFNDSAPNIKRI